MRLAALLGAGLALLAVPVAEAAASVQLAGPVSVLTDGPTTVELDVALMLEGIACTGEADIPVALAIDSSPGLAYAALTWSEILFRISADAALLRPWRGASEVGVRIAPGEGAGHVEVVASFSLPPHCRSLDGDGDGEARHRFRVDRATHDDTPAPAAARGATPPAPQAARVSGAELPAPVLGAILGMIAGGAVVLYKRMRAPPG